MQPRKHHFVPRWYLEGFADPNTGFLHVYDGSRKQWRRQKPNKIMVARDYYRQPWAPDGSDEYALEKLFGEDIEPNAKRAVFNLINNEHMTGDDLLDLFMYMSFQRLRVPRQGEMAKAVTEQMTRKFVDEHPELKDVSQALQDGWLTLEMNEISRFEFMKSLFSVFSRVFHYMVWELVRAPEGEFFLTSDSPVSLYNAAVLPPAEAGLQLAGTLVYFPLSKTHLLEGHHRYMHTTNKAEPLVRLEYPQEPPDPKETGVEFLFGPEWTAEQVRRTNWVMAELAGEMIAGNSEATIRNALEFLRPRQNTS